MIAKLAGGRIATSATTLFKSWLQVLLLLALSVFMVGCKWSGESVKRNFKVTVTAYVDGKEVKGESVYSVEWREFNKGVKEIVSGDALILDLPNKPSVFVLPCVISTGNQVGNLYYPALVMDALKVKSGAPFLSDFDKLRKANGRYDGTYGAGRTKFQPIMLAFNDETIPRTIFQVTRKNFGSHFGPGAKLGSIYFEFTDEPITRQITNRLPWLLTNGYFDPEIGFPPDPPGKVRSLSQLTFEYLISPFCFSMPER